MTIPVIPGRTAVVALASTTLALLVALLVGLPVSLATRAALAALVLIFAAALWDYRTSAIAWQRSTPVVTRMLPDAFAIGVERPVQVRIDTQGTDSWRCAFYDHADASLQTTGLPMQLTLGAGTRVEISYSALPTRRGEVTFAPADLRVRSKWGFCELLERIGLREVRRVYPDFAQVARYAWLASDRRLQEIGIKTYQQRGQGTEFKQLTEYRRGDPVRHIDWRATLRAGKPIVREFQDERDQCVMLLVDCGRRMRADDRRDRIGTSHFDQVLNAVMLLSYVALKQGDAVGALTFGTPPGRGRSFPPRKGSHALNALMAELSNVQPTLTHPDYIAAAQDLLRRQVKRSLVILITNFRDEDSGELSLALRLLQSRHLVLLASLRERIVGELIAQPLTSGDAPIEVASAHLYEQSRRDAFSRLTMRGGTKVDAEPERLGIEIVNRYHAMKRAGVI